MSKIEIINPQLKDNIDWKTLLTTTAEDLHALSHFKRKTFDALLQYATDFGTISKESLISIKRETKWGANGGQTLPIHPRITRYQGLVCRSNC